MIIWYLLMILKTVLSSDYHLIFSIYESLSVTSWPCSCVWPWPCFSSLSLCEVWSGGNNACSFCLIFSVCSIRDTQTNIQLYMCCAGTELCFATSPWERPLGIALFSLVGSVPAQLLGRMSLSSGEARCLFAEKTWDEYIYYISIFYCAGNAVANLSMRHTSGKPTYIIVIIAHKDLSE